MEQTFEILFQSFKDKGYNSKDAHILSVKLVDYFNTLGKLNDKSVLKLIEDTNDSLVTYRNTFKGYIEMKE